MKVLGLLFLFLLMSEAVVAQNVFAGRIDSFSRQGEVLVVDGVDYRVTGETIITLGDKLASRSFLQVGQNIRYTLDHKKSGEKRFISRIQLPKNDARAKQLLQH